MTTELKNIKLQFETLNETEKEEFINWINKKKVEETSKEMLRLGKILYKQEQDEKKQLKDNKPYKYVLKEYKRLKYTNDIIDFDDLTKLKSFMFNNKDLKNLPEKKSMKIKNIHTALLEKIENLKKKLPKTTKEQKELNKKLNKLEKKILHINNMSRRQEEENRRITYKKENIEKLKEEWTILFNKSLEFCDLEYDREIEYTNGRFILGCFNSILKRTTK